MEQLDIFVSVGGTATDKQEKFVCAVEERLRKEGLVPHTVGRNTFGADSPLKTVLGLMKTCSGTLVIALERSYFVSGVDKRGGESENALAEIKLPTPWNQIEAAMAYAHGHPIMVIVENGIKSEGLLEPGYDWYVQRLKPVPSSLATDEFDNILASWKSKIVRSTPTNN